VQDAVIGIQNGLFCNAKLFRIYRLNRFSVGRIAPQNVTSTMLHFLLSE